jgi:uncharacterized protein (DUF2252 family)
MVDRMTDVPGETLPERNIWQLIQIFNRQRDPNILPQKYAKLRTNAFSFFRGTCHLFYRDLPVNLITDSVPIIWICGDLHLENFGTYKGEDRQIYFGINDFDEGALAPITWEMTRLLTSIFLVADSLGLDRLAAKKLAHTCLDRYTRTLAAGKIGSIVEANSVGIVAELFKNLRKRNRRDLLDERTELSKDCRKLKFDREKIRTVSADKRQEIVLEIDNWAKSQANPDFFEVLDVGCRIAGTGSLGLDRYLILVAGKGSPDKNYLLDLKHQPSSALQPYLTIPQPQWSSQAERVMTVQQLVQLSPPALSAAIELNGNSYLLRELQPTQDKIVLKSDKFDRSQLKQIIETMAKTVAFAHLNGCGKSGASTAEDLITFGANSDWHQEIFTYARDYANQVRLDYQSFCRATQELG